jgi:two-component system CheB/CheR fusion protein
MNEFYIVGIGSSAGGLEALNELFAHMSEKPGMAFVVVPHLNRSYHSMLPFLLSKKTNLEIKHIENAEVVEPNVVYVLPENKKAIMKKGVLYLKERPESEKINKAVDTFLISLAEDQKQKAVGVILSGLGSDGTEGAICIKKNGGIVIVQDPSTAKFNSMPLSTISFDHPDFVIPANKIAGILQEIAKSKVEENRR